MHFLSSLKSQTILLVISAMVIGATATAVWVQSVSNWNRHLEHSYLTGLALHDTLRDGAKIPDGLVITQLNGVDTRLAAARLFEKLPNVSANDQITQLSLASTTQNGEVKNRINIAVVSPDLKYPIARLQQKQPASAGGKLAALLRMLTTYCSKSTLFVQYSDGPWWRVDGPSIWGCANAPMDFRLPALAMVVVSLGALISIIIATSGTFHNFAATLARRGLFSSPKSYDLAGPDELRALINVINEYQKVEQESLAKRAAFLSGVSHDLGTPATRLRLRTEFITDKDLQRKMHADIDQMTQMIKSVLSYTQSEMRMEDLRRISLISLIEAIVADYEDAGQPVRYLEPDLPQIAARTILFNSVPKPLSDKVAKQHGIVIQVRPISLQRALTNLIDNALKYGRKADVSIQASSQAVQIHIRDYGDSITPEYLGNLTRPFDRGTNAENVDGYGIGLAIASTIAAQHGGNISFENWAQGICAVLTLPR
ncbi:MAG: HAMP domain-containing histidine kinase [Candidatus Puniceispirillum sp.]|nr:HAMP domain-containing histidine kinase [Candidatus Puniceispirillum sp.]